MSEVLKVVFVAFTQHCIQSNLTHVRGVKGVLYSVYSGLLPLPGGKAISKTLSWEFSGSPPVSPRRQLCQLSWTCQLQG